MSIASSSAERTGPRRAPLAAVFGCAGPALTASERDFFRDADPLGFILFDRNLTDPAGIRRLTAELRDAVGDGDTPVLIDQEGGRVARLAPPHWPAFPSAARLARGPVGTTRKTAHAIGDMLAGLGIDVNCAPVADVHAPGVTHEVIGERAFSSDPAVVAAHARAYAEGLRDAGVGTGPTIGPPSGRGDGRNMLHPYGLSRTSLSQPVRGRSAARVMIAGSSSLRRGT